MLDNMLEEIDAWLNPNNHQIISHSKEFRVEQGDKTIVTLYLRAGKRPFGNMENRHEYELTLSRVDIHPDHQNQGLFRCLLAELNNMALVWRYTTMHVECVHSPLLQQKLPEYGFKRVEYYEDHHYRRPIDWVKNQPVPVEDIQEEIEPHFAITNRYTGHHISGFVGSEIRTSINIDKAMTIVGRELAMEMRDSLRGPDSDVWQLTGIVFFNQQSQTVPKKEVVKNG